MPKFSPFSINARLKLGKLYAEMGDTEAAIQEYATVTAHYMQLGALAKAIAIQKIISKLAPEQEQAFAKSGDAYFQQGEINEPFIENEAKPSSVDETIQEYLDQSSENPLANVSLFSYLSTAEQCKILEFSSLMKIVERGIPIIQEGDVGDCMYVIKSGEVGVYTMLMEREDSEPSEIESQGQLLLATLKEGDFFGEQALITHEPRNATIIALTDVELLRFARADLAAVIRTYPRVEELLRKYHHQRNIATISALKSALQKVMIQGSA